MSDGSSSPSSLSQALRAALARLEPLIVDDEAAATIERSNRQAAEESRRIARKARLDDQRVSLRADVLRAIVRDEPLAEQPTSLLAVRRWMARRDVAPWLLLRGRPGCGKSVAAAWALSRARPPALWCPAPRLQRVFMADWGPMAEEQDRIERATLLVIDDLGTETDPKRMQPALIRLLEARKNIEARTLITTNLTTRELEHRYPDERLRSRLEQLSVAVNDTGRDLRAKR